MGMLYEYDEVGRAIIEGTRNEVREAIAIVEEMPDCNCSFTEVSPDCPYHGSTAE